jgi:DNA-binding response OmpR family regulator
MKFQEENLKRYGVRLMGWEMEFSMQRCIVVADDDPAVVNLVKMRLRMAQFTVLAAGDSEKALAMIQAKDPVAVILDVQMPGGGGLSLLSKLKADPKTSAVPVMMLTGERNAETVLQAMDAGADDYMVKPFLPDNLAERVSRLVNKAGKHAAAPSWEI